MIDLMCAARGLDARARLKPAPATAAALSALRVRVPAGSERFQSPELAAAEESIHSGGILEAVQAAGGALA